MKILEINTESTWRGGERQTVYDMMGYVLHGHEAVLVCKNGEPLYRYAKREGLKTLQVRISFLGILQVMLSKARKFDVIHIQTTKALAIAVFTKWFHRRPLVYTPRLDLVPWGYFTKLKYRLTDKIVAISPAIEKILREGGITNVEHITEIAREQLLDKSRAGAVVKPYSGTQKKIIATVAATVPHKDPLTMIKAIALLAEKRNDFVFLHFGNGELDKEMGNWIKEYKLQNIYIQMGYVKHVEDFFSVMDVFAVSSEEEGLCNSVLDAYMYKIPVVSTDAGGLKDMVDGCGLMCGVKDHQTLADHLGKLLDDNKLREELIAKAHQKVLNDHSLAKVSTLYLNLFSRLIH